MPEDESKYSETILLRDMKSTTVILAILSIVALWSLTEPYLIQVDNITVADKGIPKSFDSKRIVYISDMHCGFTFTSERVKNLVDKVNSLKPDIIILGGDYIWGRSGNIGECTQPYANLKAPFGLYAVLGNHDNWVDRLKTIESLKSAQAVVLDNDARWVESGGSRIRIGGVGDLWTEEQDIAPTLDGVGADDYVILVSHNPMYVNSLPEDSVDLMLSGHTHGGQIIFTGLIVPFLPGRLRGTYMSGVYSVNGTELIVSNGIGTVFAPVRFMVRPQIMVITLKSI